MKYKAVNREELVRILGNQCSPGHGRQGFVIGPDNSGRLCHCASCFTIHEAKVKAKEMNGE